jgi:uncharacterized protein YggE
MAAGVAGLLLVFGLIWSRGQAPARHTTTVAAPLEGKKEPNTLRTTGTATVRIKPDTARVFFGVQTQDPTVSKARTENNRRVRKIMEALSALKISDLKTKTSDVQVDILYGRADGGQLPPITGYRVSTTFTVLVTDDDPAKLGGQASRVLDAALESGANSVQQVVFLSKNGMTDARRKALTQAVEDALANARALAAGAKKGQVEAFTIEGHPVYRDRYSGARNQMVQVANVALPEGGEGEGLLVVGELEVTCQVSVACSF